MKEARMSGAGLCCCGKALTEKGACLCLRMYLHVSLHGQVVEVGLLGAVTEHFLCYILRGRHVDMGEGHVRSKGKKKDRRSTRRKET